MKKLVSSVVVVVLGIANSSFASTTCLTGTLCDTIVGSTCVVNSAKTFVGDSLIDCAGYDVSVENPSGKIVVESGVATLVADSLTVSKYRRMEANAIVPSFVGFDIQTSGAINIGGRLIAKNVGGGSRQGIGTDKPSPRAPPSILVNITRMVGRFLYFPTGA